MESGFSEKRRQGQGSGQEHSTVPTPLTRFQGVAECVALPVPTQKALFVLNKQVGKSPGPPAETLTFTQLTAGAAELQRGPRNKHQTQLEQNQYHGAAKQLSLVKEHAMSSLQQPGSCQPATYEPAAPRQVLDVQLEGREGAREPCQTHKSPGAAGTRCSTSDLPCKGNINQLY